MSNHTYIQPMHWFVSELKGEQRYFVEGYASTINPDKFNDVVTPECQMSILSQFKTMVETGTPITLDVGHEEFVDDNGNVLARPKSNIIPVAKIVHAELRSEGVWIKAELNANSGRFNELWGSIKNGFVHAFSISYVPLKAITRKVGDTILRYLDDMNILNVTMTGVPVNTDCSFAPSLKAMLKSMAAEHKGDEGMTTQNITTTGTSTASGTLTNTTTTSSTQTPSATQTVTTGTNGSSSVTPPVTSTPPAPAEPTLADVIALVKQQTVKIAEQNELLAKVMPNTQAAAQQTQQQSNPADPLTFSPLSQIKSLFQELKKNDEEMARMKETLSKPMLKSMVSRDEPKTLSEMLTKQPFDLIG